MSALRHRKWDQIIVLAYSVNLLVIQNLNNNILFTDSSKSQRNYSLSLAEVNSTVNKGMAFVIEPEVVTPADLYCPKKKLKTFLHISIKLQKHWFAKFGRTQKRLCHFTLVCGDTFLILQKHERFSLVFMCNGNYKTVSCRWTLSVYQSSKVGHNIANNSTFCSVATCTQSCTNLHLVHSWTQSPLSHKQGQGFYSGHTLRKKNYFLINQRNERNHRLKSKETTRWICNNLNLKI